MKTPKAPSELEIVRKTWNQFELVLADRGSAKKPLKSNVYLNFIVIGTFVSTPQ